MCLPGKEATGHQGILFGATIALHVEKCAHLVLNKQHKVISTISKGAAIKQDRVPQLLVNVSLLPQRHTMLEIPRHNSGNTSNRQD